MLNRFKCSNTSFFSDGSLPMFFLHLTNNYNFQFLFNQNTSNVKPVLLDPNDISTDHVLYGLHDELLGV